MISARLTYDLRRGWLTAAGTFPVQLETLAPVAEAALAGAAREVYARRDAACEPDRGAARPAVLRLELLRAGCDGLAAASAAGAPAAAAACSSLLDVLSASGAALVSLCTAAAALRPQWTELQGAAARAQAAAVAAGGAGRGGEAVRQPPALQAVLRAPASADGPGAPTGVAAGPAGSQPELGLRLARASVRGSGGGAGSALRSGFGGGVAAAAAAGSAHARVSSPFARALAAAAAAASTSAAATAPADTAAGGGSALGAPSSLSGQLHHLVGSALARGAPPAQFAESVLSLRTHAGSASLRALVLTRSARCT